MWLLELNSSNSRRRVDSECAAMPRRLAVFSRCVETQPQIVRRFVYILWCPKGRFVYRTRKGIEQRRRDSRLRRCNRVAVEQNFESLTPTDLGKMLNSHLEYFMNCMQLCCCPFSKYIDITKFGTRCCVHQLRSPPGGPHSSTRCMRIVNPQNNGFIRNVPLANCNRSAARRSTVWLAVPFVFVY